MKTIATMTTVRCKSCDGTGVRELTPIGQRTLDAVPRTWVDTEDVNIALRGVNRTAVCNRLASLLRIGLVESRPHPTSGRVKQWRRTR